MEKNKMKKWMVPLIGGSALLGGLIAGVGSMAAAQSTASTADTSTSSSVVGTMHAHGHAPLGQDGNITAISGTTITLQEESDEGNATYTVDASGAGSLSALKVGDKVFVEGTVSGTNVTATSISAGHPHEKDGDKETNDDDQSSSQDPGQTDGENVNQ